MIVKQAWSQGNEYLKKVNWWPHNFNVELRSFTDRTYWKAHGYRAFFLHLMFPFAFPFLPEQISSHFSLYFVFLRTLYFYHDLDEVIEVEPLIRLYCQHATSIYPPTFNLYSTHAHLHLFEKVINHGALCFHNCFGNEGFTRFIRSLRSGNRLIAQQICRSLDRCRSKTSSSMRIWYMTVTLMNSASWIMNNNSLTTIGNVVDSVNNPGICFFCRASRGLSEFHSLSYRRRGNTRSFVVSFVDDRDRKCFEEFVFFF